MKISQRIILLVSFRRCRLVVKVSSWFVFYNRQFLIVSSFTNSHPAEYGVKLLTVWAVSSRIAGVMPADIEEQVMNDPTVPIPQYSVGYQTFKYFMRFRNLVDVASFLPFYVQYGIGNLPPTNFIRTLRLLRIIRVLRLLKLLSFLKNVNVMVDLIIATMVQSYLLLSVFLFFVFIIIILFGCLIFIAEQGDFTVNEEQLTLS